MTNPTNDPAGYGSGGVRDVGDLPRIPTPSTEILTPSPEKVGDSLWAVYRISPLQVGQERVLIRGGGDILDEEHARDLAKEWTEEKGEPAFGLRYKAVEQIVIGHTENGEPICVDKPEEAV